MSRGDRRRMRIDWRTRVTSAAGLGFLLSVLGAAPPADGQTCAGDCDQDRIVRVEELVLAVRIALGAAPATTCDGLDSDGSSSVEVDEVLRAVQRAISSCPGVMIVHATCRVPGPAGLTACTAGTPLTLGRCVDRARCLRESGSRRLLAIGTVDRGGSFTTAIDRTELGRGAFVVEADVGDGTKYRGVSFATADTGQSRIEIAVDPASEAGSTLIEEGGLEFFDDGGAEAVAAAVRDAVAGVDFSGVEASVARTLALDAARASASVNEIIAARATPTFTPTATRTPTVTPTHAAGVCVPPDQPTPPAVEDPTFRLGIALGVPGGTACLGGLLQTAGQPVVGYQLEIGIVPEAPIAATDGPFGPLPACAVDPRGDSNPGFGFLPPGCTPGKDCTSVRVIAIGSLSTPFPDGRNQFTCELAVSPGAAPGTFPVECSDAAASDRNGTLIPLKCIAGSVGVILTNGG